MEPVYCGAILASVGKKTTAVLIKDQSTNTCLLPKGEPAKLEVKASRWVYGD